MRSLPCPKSCLPKRTGLRNSDNRSRTDRTRCNHLPLLLPLSTGIYTVYHTLAQSGQKRNLFFGVGVIEYGGIIIT